MKKGEGTECDEDNSDLCRGCVGLALCHFAPEQVSSDAFEQAMRSRACAVMEAAYCSLVHARLCSVQRTLPRRGCAYIQDFGQLRVRHCSGSGSCSVVY